MRELGRQAVHLLFGLGIASVLLIPVPGVASKIYAAFLIAGLVIAEALLHGRHVPIFSEVVGAFERKETFPGKGAAYFVAGALFSSIFFTPGTAFVAVLSLAVLDSAATVVGITCGRHPLVNGRTLEGSVGGFLALAAVLLFIMPPLPALIAAAAAMLAELLSPVDDNLVIPPVVGAVLTLLPCS
ncbi:hypothetical protein E2N92_02030 [Methanofollis formosanus]|uniref:Phosphatidate cytidylyltransferase n=1 Tax=Methanofollis formosanus TaxID=299308 RepID=A0A8G1A0S2_9EURY|nr:hypothetical protein [Methanofollis formosanus]QYZ78294.1 hypothetical protein E2N92_02030 [Methanofollis formosanus]